MGSAHSRLIPICNAFFIQRGHRRSLPIISNRGGERRWPQNKTGVVHRYQATVAQPMRDNAKMFRRLSLAESIPGMTLSFFVTAGTTNCDYDNLWRHH